ncbi:MAG: VOC family protein [Pseudomonadota bacterium]
MITALDHFVLVCPDLDAAIADYQRLLGLDPAWRAAEDGVGTAVFALGNTALELMGPAGAGESADALRADQKRSQRYERSNRTSFGRQGRSLDHLHSPA